MSNPIGSTVAFNPTSVGYSGNSRPSVGSGNGLFSSILADESKGMGVSDADIKSFFASNPSESQIANQALRMGLNEGQIIQAMQIGGYGAGDSNALKAGIECYVSDPASGCMWGADGALTQSKVNAQSAAASVEKAMPALGEIRAFYATGPTEQQVTAKAKALGLNPAQLLQFEVAGEGMNMSQVSSHVLESRYVEAANRLGVNIGGGKHGGWTSYFSPTLGRAVTKTEMQDFFARKPTQSQIFQQAASLGLGMHAVNNMMNGLGMPDVDPISGTRLNRMDTSLFQGKDGFSLDQYGHIVAGGGKHFVSNAQGTSGSWEPGATTIGQSSANA
jgi:hypothetical protein